MSSAAAKLLEQVVANPRDTDARAVYADALIQDGDPRGTFITLQAAMLGRLSPDRREAALHQSRALFKEHEAKWLATTKGWAQVRMRGGFVHAIRAKAADFLKHGEALVAAEPVLEVVLHGAGDEDLKKLAASPAVARLQSLALGGTYGDKGAVALAESAHLKTLEWLNLGASKAGKGFAAAVGGLAGLVSLCLTGASLGDDGAKTFAAAALPKLTHLYLTRNDLTDACMGDLGDGRALATVQMLTLNGNEITDEGLAAFTKGKSLGNLARLELRETQIGEEAAKALGKLKALKKLDVKGTEVEVSSLGGLKRKGVTVVASSSYY